jgi:hypothetical protein
VHLEHFARSNVNLKIVSIKGSKGGYREGGDGRWRRRRRGGGGGEGKWGVDNLKKTLSKTEMKSKRGLFHGDNNLILIKPFFAQRAPASIMISCTEITSKHIFSYRSISNQAFFTKITC